MLTTSSNLWEGSLFPVPQMPQVPQRKNAPLSVCLSVSESQSHVAQLVRAQCGVTQDLGHQPATDGLSRVNRHYGCATVCMAQKRVAAFRADEFEAEVTSAQQ